MPDKLQQQIDELIKALDELDTQLARLQPFKVLLKQQLEIEKGKEQQNDNRN